MFLNAKFKNWTFRTQSGTNFTYFQESKTFTTLNLYSGNDTFDFTNFNFFNESLYDEWGPEMALESMIEQIPSNSPLIPLLRKYQVIPKGPIDSSNELFFLKQNNDTRFGRGRSVSTV